MKSNISQRRQDFIPVAFFVLKYRSQQFFETGWEIREKMKIKEHARKEHEKQKE